MRYCILYIFAFMVTGLLSCDKKKEDTKNIVIIPTDSVYSYAMVDSLTFTGAETKATFYNTDNPYLIFTAKTGPDSDHKAISFRIDNFLNKAGEYIIGDSTDAKALYGKNDSISEVALGGKIIIKSLDKSIRGTFYFYTAHHSVTSGTFSAQ